MTALVNLYDIKETESKHNAAGFTNVSNFNLLKDRLYEGYENEMEIVVSLENDLFTYNHTMKLSELEIEEDGVNNNIHIVDSWLEANIKITPKVNIEYDNVDTFLISDSNLKILITFL